jgi:hypothetical protein
MTQIDTSFFCEILKEEKSGNKLPKFLDEDRVANTLNLFLAVINVILYSSEEFHPSLMFKSKVVLTLTIVQHIMPLSQGIVIQLDRKILIKVATVRQGILTGVEGSLRFTSSYKLVQMSSFSY